MRRNFKKRWMFQECRCVPLNECVKTDATPVFSPPYRVKRRTRHIHDTTGKIAEYETNL